MTCFRHLLLVGIYGAVLLNSVCGHIITIDAHAEECFLQKADKGDILVFGYEVIEGGFLDIDMSIYEPQGGVFVHKKRETSNRFTFTAAQDGVYRYCFSNLMSTMTPKLVTFSMEHSARVNPDKAFDSGNDVPDGPNKVADLLKELTDRLSRVSKEHKYLEYRTMVHHKIAQRTNSRVVLWAIFEAIAMLAVSVSNVVYLRKFFEVRSVI